MREIDLELKQNKLPEKIIECENLKHRMEQVEAENDVVNWYIKIMEDHNPSMMSRREYLANKIEKRTNIMQLKPEKSGLIDKRMAESDF